jgi:hypothetical protein
MESVTKHKVLLLGLFICISYINVLGQTFTQLETNAPKPKRNFKTRLEGGLAFGFYNNDPHYTNSTRSKVGFELGVKEEIPFINNSSILVGLNLYTSGLSFNSYYFDKGYSVLYIPSEEIYNHNIRFTELHFPVEYKGSFSPETVKDKTMYFLIGWVYRLMVSNSTSVTNATNGDFVFDGTDDLTYKYNLFTKTGSSIIEIGLGYQHNKVENGKALFAELTFDYGISPVNYSGNTEGSNNINFNLNTLSLKIGGRF